ncbi:MAG: histidine kinase [Muribaculaceae bacterium]|nr:histidine kinase [Muribaculaceae bacterium]
MTLTNKNRRTENVVYMVLWLIATGLYLLDTMQIRYRSSEPLFDLKVLINLADTIAPFAVLFLVNNYLLIPKLFVRNRWGAYFTATTLIIALMVAYQYYEFVALFETHHAGRPAGPSPHAPPLVPLPVLLEFVYSLLVVGVNLAVAMTFRYFEDRLETERLMKANAENQLAYLKAQINPHFYMNMLNNIHGMIEIDPERAQTMVIDMSSLMRYMLYDSSKPQIRLSDEIAFLNNYLNLMRQRYPESKVSIARSFPSAEQSGTVQLPPLLFLVFIENAFKHGISYKAASWVDVEIEIKDGRVEFLCVNSRHPETKSINERSGIGLRNIRQRLQLLYGDTAALDIAETPTEYRVRLTLPLNHHLMIKHDIS